MKGALGVALGCALGVVEAKAVKWGRDGNQRSWTPPQETLGVMPELFNANIAPLPTPAPVVSKQDLERRAATDNTCAYVGGTLERSLYCDTTAFCAANSINSHVGCCDDTKSASCTVWTTCLALSESAKYTTNNGLTLWCGFTDYPNCITHIYADTKSPANMFNGYTLLGCAVAAGSDSVYYTAFTSSKSSSSSKIILTPNDGGSTTIPDVPDTTEPPLIQNSKDPNNDAVGVVTTLYDTITSDGVVYTTATATATVPASGANSGDSKSTSKRSSSVGAIAGGVVGGVAALALIALAIWLLMRKKSADADAAAVSPPAPQPTIPAVAQVTPPPAAGYYARESIAKPPFATYDNVSNPSQSPPPPQPQSPISPYQQSTPSPPPPGSNGGGHYSVYGAAAVGAGAAAGYAAAGYGHQGQQQQQYQQYQNQAPQQEYQNQPQQGYQQPPPPQQQQQAYQNQQPQQQQTYQNQQPQGYQNQAPVAAAGYGYQQPQQQQQGYPPPQQQGQYPPPQPQPYPQGGYAPPQGQQGFVSELPTQRGDGEVRELHG